VGAGLLLFACFYLLACMKFKMMWLH